jgi:hypothetical protein
MSARHAILSILGVVLLFVLAFAAVLGTLFGIIGIGECRNHPALATTDIWLEWIAILAVSFTVFALSSAALVRRLVRAVRGARAVGGATD